MTIHLSHSGLLLPQTHNDDAVRLSDATLSPRSQRTVRLIQNNPVDVLLLTQPAWQTVLMNTEKEILYCTWTVNHRKQKDNVWLMLLEKKLHYISICILSLLNGMQY